MSSIHENGRWVAVTPESGVPPREGRTVSIDGLELALVNTSAGFAAIENRCPHQGGPLSDGIVSGSTIICPLHGWKICLETGQVLSPAAGHGVCVRRFPVSVESGIVSIFVPEQGLPDKMEENRSAESICSAA